MTATVIPTEYGGVLFRSRLEARWAIFFDRFGFKWEYEPEGFVGVGGTKYLPDFYIPNAGECEGGPAYFEVKPMIGTDPTPDPEWVAKARIAAASGTRVIIAIGPPAIGRYQGESWDRVTTPFWEVSDRRPNAVGELWVGIDFGMPHFLSNDPWHMYYEMDAKEREYRTDHNFWSPELIQAAASANRHRFWEPRNG